MTECTRRNFRLTKKYWARFENALSEFCSARGIPSSRSKSMFLSYLVDFYTNLISMRAAMEGPEKKIKAAAAQGMLEKAVLLDASKKEKPVAKDKDKDEDDEYITRGEAAIMLGLSTFITSALRAEKKIVVHRHPESHRWLVSKKSVEKYLKKYGFGNRHGYVRTE